MTKEVPFLEGAEYESVLLKEGERADDLLRDQLRIIQSDEVFAFSMDAVLLARFCRVPKRGRMVDLCSGNGVIPLLLSSRTSAGIVGVEIQERLADMAERSVRLNGLSGQIEMICADLKQVHEQLGHGEFDLVTVNPPYLAVQAGDQNVNAHVAAARHEIHCTLDDVAAACARLVRFGGKVAMVHRPARLVDILETFRRHRLEPKRLRLVHPKAGEEANMVLIEAIREGKPELRVLPPLIVHEESGRYSEELLSIYYGQADQLQDRNRSVRDPVQNGREEPQR